MGKEVLKLPHIENQKHDIKHKTIDFFKKHIYSKNEAFHKYFTSSD